MRRAGVVQTLSDLLSFAKIVASGSGASQSAEVRIDAGPDDASRDQCELWGHAPLLYKPLAGAEAFYVELGDERVVLATKDRRYQVEIEAGEVVVRAMGAAAPAHLKLTPDGTCVVTALRIELGGGGASLAVALAPLVEAALKGLGTALQTAAAGLGADVGAPAALALANAVTSWASTIAVGAQKTKAE